MRIFFSLLMLSFMALGFASCSGKGEASYPEDQDRDRKLSRGRVTGEEGFVLTGRSDKDGAGNSPIGVNSFLWRATLDTLAFMPLISADPFGGVIITDWYEDPATPGERFKINALILDRSLRADGIKISLFKQAKGSDGQWHDTETNPDTARQLENTILTRARELRVRQSAQ